MKHTACPLLTIALALGAPAAGAAVNAPIRSVVLYPNSAVVQRELTVSATTPTVEVGGLPTDFTLESLHLECSPGIHVGQVRFKDAATTDSLAPRQSALEARIQALSDQEDELQVDSHSAEQVQAYIARLSTGADPAHPGPALDPRSLAGVLATIRTGMSESLTTMQRVAVRKRALDKELEADRRDLAALEGSQHAVRTVRFDVFAEHPGRILLSYPMADAGWSPKYRAVLDSSTGRVSLERQALVHQQTGEDWSDVRVKLSTGAPDANAHAPDTTPWLVNVIRPEPRERRVEADYALAAPAPPPVAIAAAAPRMEPLKAKAPVVAESQTAFDTVFDMESPLTLPSDGSQVTVTLNTQILDAKPRIRTIPRLEAAAYVEADAERPAGIWLPGEVQLVRDGNYVGTLNWQPDESERFVLSFGRDDQVRVRYTRNNTSNGSGSFLDSRLKREVTDTFTVTSSHSNALPLLVLEPSPVSTSDEVKVSKEFTPKAESTEWEDQEGVVAWQSTLLPKSSQTFQSRYTITYPKDKIVAGLP